MSKDDSDSRVVREILLWALENGNYNLGLSGENLRNDSHFSSEIGIQSLDLLEFFLRLEDQFDIEIHARDYNLLTSVQAVTEFLKGGKVALEVE
jgi:acyl carrier protein